MIRRHTRAAMLLASMVFCLGRSAVAQQCPEATTPEQDRERAAQEFSEGQRIFETGDHAQALIHFECSYSLYPHRDTLFNVGRCHEELGSFADASRSYRLYIERYPEAPDVADIEARVLNIEQRLGSHESSEEDSTTPSEGEPDRQESEALPQTVTRMSTARIMAWVTLGLGLAFGAPGAGLLGAAGSTHNDFEAALNNPTVWDSVVRDTGERGQTFETVGWALFGVGAASLLTSIILFAAFDSREAVERDHSRRSRRTLALSPLIGDRVCALTLSGTL